jgi:Holliday junction resolvase RusA-like endonuclease
MKDVIEFSVFGDPVAKGRARHTSRGGFVRSYTPKKTASYEQLVAACFRDVYADFKPLEGALSVDLYIFKPVPKYWPKKRREASIFGLERPTGKPDCDNYAKIILDALNGIAYIDDSQVVTLRAEKHYAEIPRVFVSIKPL